MGQFGRKLSKLGLAILENFVEKNLGEKFVGELRSPTDRELAIQTALENVEDRFQKEFDDKDLYNSMFIGLPIDKTKLREAIGKFFDRPTDSDFPKILSRILKTEFKNLSQTRIDNAVSFYIKVLKQELALVDDEFREKIKALTDLETLEYIKEISKNLRQPDKVTETNLSKQIVELPTYHKDSELDPSGDLPLGSHLPFSPNALFTGREKELKKLADSILGDSKTNTVITQAVTGMGGLGKTQLAVEFGYRYGKYFRGVHWLNLVDPSQLDSEIANCGRGMFALDFPEDQPSQVALTLQTWKTNGPNLLILDNFEETKVANDVFTKLRHSNIRVLVTSRRMDWSQTLGLTQLPLDLFSEEESLQFLKDSLKNRKDSEDDLKNLAERLGHLPLGLELASRYLNGHARLSISEYLKQTENALDHASMKNWRADMPTATGHNLDLQRTFSLSWQEIKEETAQKIFMMVGYLAPNTPIPLEIFEKALEISPEICDEIMNSLYGLGLLTKGEDDLPVIHPLLSEYAQNFAKENIQLLEILTMSFSELVSSVNNSGLPRNFLPLRPHLSNLAIQSENKKLEIAGRLWNSIGYHLKEIADYTNAIHAYEHALKIDEANFGKNHPNVARDVNNLGSVLQDLGDLNGAKVMFERALEIDETNFDKDHPNVAIRVNNLGSVLQNLGDLNGAKVMFERALEIDETNFGKDHPNVAIRVNNLGSALQDLGDLNGAKVMYERALKIDETNFGKDHPNVARDVNNLGSALQDSGDLNGAKVMFERALKIDETNFGKDHPNVARDVNNLGSALQDLGDLNGAKVMYERTLRILEKTLPTEHPFVANTINNLGLVMKNVGELNGARVMFERALKIDETSFGKDHPNVAIDVNNLGTVMKDQGDLVGARAMYERALKIFKKFLPADHPNIKIVQGNLDSLDKS